MTADNVLPFRQREKPNLIPSNLMGSTVRAWGEALEDQEPFILPGFPLVAQKIAHVRLGKFQFQFFKQRDGYVWRQWALGHSPINLEILNIFKLDRREA